MNALLLHKNAATTLMFCITVSAPVALKSHLTTCTQVMHLCSLAADLLCLDALSYQCLQQVTASSDPRDLICHVYAPDFLFRSHFLTSLRSHLHYIYTYPSVDIFTWASASVLSKQMSNHLFSFLKTYSHFILQECQLCNVQLLVYTFSRTSML